MVGVIASPVPVAKSLHNIFSFFERKKHIMLKNNTNKFINAVKSAKSYADLLFVESFIQEYECDLYKVMDF